MHDLTIIGGGPAGLSAAANAAAEGLNVVLLEAADVLGGQAGTSSRIENYLGFPQGVDGVTLTSAAARQAKRLGADLRTGKRVERLEHNPATELWVATCEAGDRFVSRAVLLAVGVDYRRFPVEVDPHELVLYGAPASAHEECAGHPVVVVGGGNSAGQAALNLARIGAHVALLVRRPLRQTMSRYLIERIATAEHITARIGEVAGVYPESPGVVLKGGEELDAHRIFAYIGSEPRTAFVSGCCSTVPPGFIPTDENFQANDAGLFVAGDVREGSYKRVAAAVGEGAVAAAAVWRFIFNA